MSVWHVMMWLAAASFLMCACTIPGNVKPTTKIGLSAPFEGLHRDQGYEVLHAVRLAVRNRNEAGGVGGRYLVEMVALNDFNEVEEARLQASEMAADPDVMGVLGGWTPETALQSAAAYRRRNLVFLAPEADWHSLGMEAARLAVRELGLRRATVLHGQEPGDIALADAFSAAFKEEGAPSSRRIAPTEEDLTLRQILDGSDPPEAILLAADASTAARWMVEAREAGFDGAFIGGPKLGSPLVPDIAGKAGDGAFFVSHYTPLSGDPDFMEGYLALSGGAPPSPVAEWAFVAANRLLAAMDEVTIAEGAPSRTSVQEALGADAGGDLNVLVYMVRAGEVYASYQPSGAGSD